MAYVRRIFDWDKLERSEAGLIRSESDSRSISTLPISKRLEGD